MMLRAHLLLAMLLRGHLLATHHLLIHRMLLPVSSIHVFGSFVGARFGFVTCNMSLVTVKILGLVPVCVFFSFHACSGAAMFSPYVPGLILGFSRASSRCSSSALRACALAVLLVE